MIRKELNEDFNHHNYPLALLFYFNKPECVSENEYFWLGHIYKMTVEIHPLHVTPQQFRSRQQEQLIDEKDVGLVVALCTFFVPTCNSNFFSKHMIKWRNWKKQKSCIKMNDKKGTQWGFQSP